MRSATRLLITLAFVFASSTVFGDELAQEEKEVWETLERQVGLFVKKDWKKHQEYIHPKAVFWGGDEPAPSTAQKSSEFEHKLFEEMPPIISYYLSPVTVLVVDDVAIINFYMRILSKPEDVATVTIWRGHNTWKKEDGKWKLLSIYNTEITKEDE